MSRLRWLELLSGLAASALGLLVLAYVLFGPLYNTASCTGSSNDGTICTQGTATLLEVNHGLQPITILYLSFAALVFLSLAMSTVLHIHSGNRTWQISLWSATILLLFLSIFPTALAIFFLPSMLLALLASVCAVGNRHLAAG